MIITFFLKTFIEIWVQLFVELISVNISSLSRSILLYPVVEAIGIYWLTNVGHKLSDKMLCINLRKSKC